VGERPGEGGAGDGAAALRRRQSERALQLMELLGLSDEELCRTLDVDPLSLLSGQIEHSRELRILLELLAEAQERASAALLRRWVRSTGPAGRPIDALLARDFGRFENALALLAQRGFVLRGGTAGPGDVPPHGTTP
jgi:hypothetical protein